MAVYYLDEYIEATKLMVKEAKMKWINGVDWDDEQYEKLKFLEKNIDALIEMRKHGQVFYTDF